MSGFDFFQTAFGLFLLHMWYRLFWVRRTRKFWKDFIPERYPYTVSSTRMLWTFWRWTVNINDWRAK